MRFKLSLNGKLRGNRKAVSPAISTVILTSAVVALLLVTIVFANNFLNARMAENEFSAMEQFMQNVGLQIDDVAWIPGSTRTIRYTSKYGHVNFEPAVLNYSVYVNGEWWNFTTGIILFNMPVSHYSLGNGYYRSVYPSSRSFLNYGPSAPVSYVFVVEKLPMHDGGFIRVVVVPTIRVLNSKFYLPILSNGTSPRLSQSVTVTGKNISVKTAENVANITIRVSFPKFSSGFDRDFFNFFNETIPAPMGGVVEFYVGEVMVSLGRI
ncbi:MAG: hypothetical protein QW270_07305 [Candidatus Bathyarchaeia archaeon]